MDKANRDIEDLRRFLARCKPMLELVKHNVKKTTADGNQKIKDYKSMARVLVGIEQVGGMVFGARGSLSVFGDMKGKRMVEDMTESTKLMRNHASDLTFWLRG